MIANSFSAHYPILSYASLTNNNYNCFRCAECNHVPTDCFPLLLHLAEMASVNSSMYSLAIFKLLRKAKNQGLRIKQNESNDPLYF